MNIFKLDKVKGKYIYDDIYSKIYLVLTTRKNHYMHALCEYMKPAPLIQLFGATFGFNLENNKNSSVILANAG